MAADSIRRGFGGVGDALGGFAPVRNLGLIVVDEEHDGSYKQERRALTARRRRGAAQAAARWWCWGRHTSLESRYNVERAKYTLTGIARPHRSAAMPVVELIDMREEFLETRQQAPSRANWWRHRSAHRKRRADHRAAQPGGFSSFVACRACGERVAVHNCSLTLTSTSATRLLCHYCGYAEKVPAVPNARASHLLSGRRFGEGGRRAAPRISGSAHCRLDRDTVTGSGNTRPCCRISARQLDILVGRRMMPRARHPT